jgi:regulation of enolase protein 1 (concanavalin A-like superfamily)
MRWLNEPREWSGDASALTVRVEPNTDFWRTTHTGVIADNGHFADTGALALRFRGDFAAQYDQAGLMLRVDATRWIKAGIELADGRLWLSAVVTDGVSDWSQQPAPEPDADGWYEVRAVREGDAIQFLCAGQPFRLAPFPEGELMAGPMCAAPTGGGFTAHFHALPAG